MDKPKKQVGFSEPLAGDGDGEQGLVQPQSSSRRSPLASIFIPKPNVLSPGSQGLPTPNPFSPDYPVSPGGTSFGPYNRRRYRRNGHQRDLEMDEPNADPAASLGDDERKWYGQKDKLAPESAITLFAYRVAILEKIASNLGTVAFLWATVVLLGGFATTAKITDFWVVALLLFTEGVRIFGRSHELEWQHVASKATTNLAASAKMATNKVYQVCFNTC